MKITVNSLNLELPSKLELRYLVVQVCTTGATFTAKTTAWPTAQASGDGWRTLLVTLRKEYESEYKRKL